MQEQRLARPQGGLSADALKIIAIVAMTIDHAAWQFVQPYYGAAGSALHAIGRITGPVMFYFIVEGYHHTRNRNKYTLRLGLFAAVSYLPFIYFMTGALPNAETAFKLNVIYTLFLGHLMLRALHEIRNVALKYAAVAVLMVASFWGDWGIWAMLFILVFDVFRTRFSYQAAGYSVLVLARLLPEVQALLTAAQEGGAAAFASARMGSVVVQGAMFLPLALLWLYNGKKDGLGRWGRWLFYVYYPLHLLVLGWMKSGMMDR